MKKVRSILDHGKEQAGMDIHSFLIMPVQRIPRYELLLKSLLEATLPSEKSYDSINLALDRIRRVAMAINEKKRETEALMELLQLEQSLPAESVTKFSLFKPGRKLLKSSSVQMIVESPMTGSKRLEPVQLLLFNDLLIWAEPSKVYRGHVSLTKADVLSFTDDQFGLGLTVLERGSMFWFILPNIKEIDMWVDMVDEAKESLEKQAQQKQGRSRSGADFEVGDLVPTLSRQRAVLDLHSPKAESAIRVVGGGSEDRCDSPNMSPTHSPVKGGHRKTSSRK